MRKIELALDCFDKQRRLTGYEIAPGLAIHKSPDHRGWGITHVTSGRAVGGHKILLRSTATAIAKELAPLADWTLPQNKLNNKKLANQVCGILRKYNC